MPRATASRALPSCILPKDSRGSPLLLLFTALIFAPLPFSQVYQPRGTAITTGGCMHALPMKNLCSRGTLVPHPCVRQRPSQPSCFRARALALRPSAARFDTCAFVEDPLRTEVPIEMRLHKALLPEWRRMMEEQFHKTPKLDSSSGGTGGAGKNGGGGGGGKGGGGGGGGEDGAPQRRGYFLAEWYWWSGSLWDIVCWLFGTMAVWVAAGVAQVGEESKGSTPVGLTMEPLAG